MNSLWCRQQNRGG